MSSVGRLGSLGFMHDQYFGLRCCRQHPRDHLALAEFLVRLILQELLNNLIGGISGNHDIEACNGYQVTLPASMKLFLCGAQGKLKEVKLWK